jgi:hypothetical protein
MSVMQNTLIKRLMAFEALTLAVASVTHLIGGSYDAGVAEGLICVALLVGLSKGGRVAVGALYFAIFGFAVGLMSTLSEGETGGLAYHMLMLPILAGTLLLLMRTRRVTRPA